MGSRLPSTFRLGPREEIPPSLSTPTCASTTGQAKRGKARQGKAHPTESHATAIHSFCIFNIALSPPTQRFFPECCTSCDQIAVSAAQRDCALSPQFPWPVFSIIFLLSIFSVSLYVTIPNTDQHTKRAHETSLSV